MKFPASTGQVAVALNVSEPKLNHLLRRGRIRPVPRVVAGRRLWGPEEIAQAAEHFRIPRDQPEERLRALAAVGGEEA